MPHRFVKRIGMLEQLVKDNFIQYSDEEEEDKESEESYGYAIASERLA